MSYFQKAIILACTSFIVLVSSYAQEKTQAAQQPESHYFSSFDGAKIYYEVKGKGYPVLLIHGFTGSGESWKKTAVYDSLFLHGYQVITVDLRGNGKSDKPHTDEAYASDAEAKDIQGIISTLHLNHYAVVGYSRGSIITARLLVLDKRVSKAVMGGMGADFTNPEWPRRKMFYHVLAGDTTVKELEGMLQYVQQSGFDRVALTYQQKYQPSTSRADLNKVKQPVLVLCGDKDSDNGTANELVALFPKGRFIQVPGDHGHASATPEFASAVLAFVHP